MQNDGKTNNVVSLGLLRKKMQDEKKAAAKSEGMEVCNAEDFLAVIQKNKKIEEKMKRDRAKANRSVLKSFRIK